MKKSVVVVHYHEIALKGNKFKSKRSSINYFTRHFDFDFLPFKAQYKNDCLGLYERWKDGRKSVSSEPVFRGMLEDSYSSLRIILEDFAGLGAVGRIVKVNRTIKAFTIGYELSPEMFCVLFEVADLSVKGLAQFIFREFCREIGCDYINIMDDLGAENLEKVKLSYRPVRTVPSYVIIKNK